MPSLFDLPLTRGSSSRDKDIVNKVKKQEVASSKYTAGVSIAVKGSGKLTDRIPALKAFVKSKFAGKEDEFLLIREEAKLKEYIDKAIENGVISIDTETTGLDPILDHIVGLCLYTPTLKAAYVPIHHISYITGAECRNQISVEFCREQMQRVVDSGIRTIFFNAPFDVRIIKNSLGVYITPYFDCSIAAHALYTEEPTYRLKPLHNKYCRGGEDEAYTFDELFDGLPFDIVPIDVAYLYASNDAVITYELYRFQAQYLEPDGCFYHNDDMEDLSNMFFNVEMKSMPTFIAMEETGTAIDYDHAERISKEYHDYDDKMSENLKSVIADYQDVINDYRRKNPACRLTDPINPESSVQLAIILYDILKLQSPDKKNPRGTGKEILEQIDHPLCKAILDVRRFKKVLSTYIDKIPEDAKRYPDHRIHCRFNQYGAATGRVSSNSPNLQNIPSNPFVLSDGTKIDSGHDIRQLFAASPGHVLMSCDYSGQEVRVTAHLSQDQKMIKAYKDGKDVYSEIAAISFNKPYEECCEFAPDGSKNPPECKARRGEAKKIVLGVLYGRGIPSIAEQLGKTPEEAQEIYNKVLSKFDGVKNFISDSEDMAVEKGYVTTVWGRRRNTPDMQLPVYEFTYRNGYNPNFDPLSDEEGSNEVPLETVKELTNKLLRCRRYADREALKARIRESGINIIDNSRKIGDARRQTINARVQGRLTAHLH